MSAPTIMPLWFGGVTGISNVIDITTVKYVVGLIMPPAWTPAVVTVEGSADGAEFFTLYERGGTRFSFSVPPGSMIAIDPNRMRCCKAFRLLSGTREMLVPQVAAREFGVVVEL